MPKPPEPPGQSKTGYDPQPPPDGSVCSQCAYWRQMANTPSHGLCYRMPPQVLPIVMHIENGGGFYYHTQRPHTKDTEAACGEFTPIS